MRNAFNKGETILCFSKALTQWGIGDGKENET